MSEFAFAMREAVRLARRGRWKTAPNPCVGAVLVRNGEIVASGWHEAYGGPHAERVCLNDAAAKGIDPASCTLVVTLEPCCHEGKTPACTEAVLAAGIRHVVAGTADPNPKACGGIDFLRSQGVTVEIGVEEQLCRDLIADFVVWQQTDMPYVILKLAGTLDGYIATRTGQSKWVTGKESHRRVHEMRAGVGLAGGAVFVGGSTYAMDNPGLDARMGFESGPQPLAAIITSRLPDLEEDGIWRSTLLRQRPEQAIFLTCLSASLSPAAERLRTHGVRVWGLTMRENDNNVPAASSRLGTPGLRPRLDVAEGLARLRSETGCLYVLCEGGGTLGLHLLRLGLLGEFHLHLAPKILADRRAEPLFSGHTAMSMSEAFGMRITDLELVGEDAHLILRPKDGQTNEISPNRE